MIELSETSFDPSAMLSAFTSRLNGSGAIVSFTGLVRNRAGEYEVQELILQAYSPMTKNGMAEIVQSACERWNLEDVHVVHRTGSMKPGDPIVFVATAAPHRREAFKAADFIMDYLKTEAVFWKKEITQFGSNWIEPREADYEDAARWKQSIRSE